MEERKNEQEKKPSAVKRFFSAIGNTAQKTAKAVQQGVQTAATMKEQADYAARLKKYNPLFPKEYTSEEFHLPNVVRIVDDAERRDIDVCKGAIGWRSKEKEVEVLHLYDEAVDFSGLKFLPAPICNKVYTVHPYNRNVFIAVDEYAKIVQQEKLAELQEVAFCLGAKRYWVEMEDSKETRASVDVTYGGKEEPLSEKVCLTGAQRQKTKGQAYLVCKGKGKPSAPALCWYKEDKNVAYLIKLRCSRAGRKMREHTLRLYDLHSTLHDAVFSVAAKFGVKLEGGIGAKQSTESNRIMLVNLEF